MTQNRKLITAIILTAVITASIVGGIMEWRQNQPATRVVQEDRTLAPIPSQLVRIDEPKNGETIRRDRPYPSGNPILVKGTTLPNYLVWIYGDESCITRNTFAAGAGRADGAGRFDTALGFVREGKNVIKVLALDPVKEPAYGGNECLPAENISLSVEFNYEGEVFKQ